MSSPNKYYPVQGSNKFETVSFPMTKAFTVDFGGSAATNTFALETFTKGSVILGFVAKVVEAMETGGAGTVKFGFSGTIMMSTARASGAATLDTIIPVVGPLINISSPTSSDCASNLNSPTPILSKYFTPFPM